MRPVIAVVPLLALGLAERQQEKPWQHVVVTKPGKQTGSVKRRDRKRRTGR